MINSKYSENSELVNLDDTDTEDFELRLFSSKSNLGTFVYDEDAENIEREDDEDFIIPQTRGIRLRHTIGVLTSMAMISGTIVGCGIFTSLSSVYSRAGSIGASLLIWLISGLLSTFGAMCYVELGTMIPYSGGEYIYLYRVYGKVAAFLFSWTFTLILKPAHFAAISYAFAEYVISSFNGDCSVYMNISYKPAVKLLAAICIGIIAFVNCASVRWATRVQVIFTGAKLFAIAMLIITGLVRLAQGFDDNFSNAFEGTTTSISNIGYAFYGGLWAYDGWNNLNYVTEELKHPMRDLPLAIMIGIPLVTGCYVLVNVAYLTVLTKVEIATSGAVAVTLANRLYGVMAWIIPVFVACSTFGAANGSAFAASRLVFVSAREGHMPKILSMIHAKRRTPLPAMLLNATIAWLMLIPDSTNFEVLINYFSFAAWTFYGATISALLYLRFKEPDLKRPYKVFVVIPIFILLVSIYLVAAPFYDSPLQSFFCLLFILMGIPVYYCIVHKKMLPAKIDQCIDWLTYKLQTIGDLSPPSEGAVEMDYK